MSEIALYSCIYFYCCLVGWLVGCVCLFVCLKNEKVAIFLKLDMRWILLCCLALIVTRCDENDHHVSAWKAVYD